MHLFVPKIIYSFQAKTIIKKMILFHAFWAALTILPNIVSVSSQSHIYESAPAGRYCEASPRRCCISRDDECGTPFSGTVCYCDEFCNRTRNSDCCPDYWSYCKGIITTSAPEPIKSCYFNGRYYQFGETTKINCNECKCQDMNGQLEVLCENNQCLIDEDLLERVNRHTRRLGWEARNYTMFWGRTYEEGLTLRLGTLHSKNNVLQMLPIKQVIDTGKLDRNFDARIHWPEYISSPKDQGWCGASWVFSTVGIASDRFAIMTRGQVRDYLSPQQLLNCDVRGQTGCQGGHLTNAWMYIRKYGLVRERCYPWEGTFSDSCKIPRRRKSLTTVCPSQIEKTTDIHRVGPAYRIAGEHGIMQEILFSGPVQAVMKVPREFFVYHNGIYRCANLTYDDRTGYHSVRIIGWGEEVQNGQLVKYWIAANSWGEYWGENGYFRIQKGTNECFIEDFVIAVWANVNNSSAYLNNAQSYS